MADEKEYTHAQMKRDMNELKWESRIQTVAVILLFFWGIATVNDIIKKSK